MPVLLRNAYYTLEKEGVSPVLYCVLSAASCEDEAAVRRAQMELAAALEPFDRRRHVILVDVRQGPTSHEPGIEEVLRQARRILFADFNRAAVIVKTAAGRLQAIRHARDDGLEPRIFLDDEEAARAYLSAPPDAELT